MNAFSRVSITLFLSLIIFFHPLSAGDDPQKPISGKSFTITYTIPKDSPLKTDGLQVEYVFDYWGTLASANRCPSMLYQNVLHPKAGRARTVLLNKNGNTYFASINIPNNASLLSYYVTDGKERDDNNKATYVLYIYNTSGKPVMGARFRNIDFLIMANRSLDDQLAELVAEVQDYPQYYVAYIAYWTLRFLKNTSLDSLRELKPSIETMLTSMERYGVSKDTVANLRAGLYYRYVLQLGKFNAREYTEALRDLESKFECIPEKKRFPYTQELYLDIKGGALAPKGKTK